MATSLQERLKLKQYQVDTWTPREQLCLASAVMRSGDQNWVAVSRTIKTLTTETNRPLDWYSTKNCALMYAKLLEKVDAPKRKRDRAEPTNTNVETPGEIVTKMLAKQRIEELRVLEAQSRTSYNHLRQQIQHLDAGMLDHTLDAEWEAFVRERKEEEEKERLHREWLKQREEKIHAIQKALKHQIPKVPISTSSSCSLNKKVAGRQSWASTSSSERRDSGMSDNSELDLALDSPGISSPMVEESTQLDTETKPVPTSPLLSSLLSKPPNPPGSSNVATDLRQSFNLASARGRVGLTPNVSSALQNLVSSAISGTDATLKDHQKNTTTSPGSAAPTLSRLLELPPRPPGDPMPSITDLPPTHAETMAQVHKESPPQLKKPKLDIEALAAEAAESLLSDTLLNDLDDQLDDEGMDEEEERKKEEELSSVSVTPPEIVSQEGGKTREHQCLKMSETCPSKLLGGKADPQKCSEGSSPEANADVPLEEDKKGEETVQVGEKRKEEKEAEKQLSTDTQHVEQELLDKENLNEKEREELYKMKRVVVEIKDIMKDKKIENMIKKSELYNNEEITDVNKETKTEIEKNDSNEEQNGEKYNAQCAEKSKDENVNKIENVENGNTEKGDRKIEGSRKRKLEGKEGEHDKHKRNYKKKEKKYDKEHRKSKKNKKYKHKEKTEESEMDESEKESKGKESRSDKERSKDKKGEKEKNKVKEKYKENKSERDRHKDKKEAEKDDNYKKVNKHDKDETTVEKKHDKHKSKHESEKSQIIGDMSKAESDKEKDNEECNDRPKEKKIKLKRTTDIQGETDKNEKFDETKKLEVEKEIGNCTENVNESKELEIQDKNESNKLCVKDVEKDVSELDDNRNDTSDIVKTETIKSSSYVSYADKVKIQKKTIESNISTEDQMNNKENNKEREKICKDTAAEIDLDSKNVEDQESISVDEEMESKENNCNVNNTDNTGNVKQKSYKIQLTKQNDSKDNMKVLDSNSKTNNEENLNNKSSEVKAKSNSNQGKATSGEKDEDMTDKLDDMSLKARKKKMVSGFGKADVFPAEDSPMDDSEQADDIKEAVKLETTDVKHIGVGRGRPKKNPTPAAPTEDIDEDSMDASQNKKEQDDISVTFIKKSSTEESKRNIELKLEKSETDVSSLNISVSLKKEGNEVHEKKNKKDEKEKKEVELEEMLLKMDDEDKESLDEEKRGKKKKKGVYLEDDFMNEDSRDAMSEEDMLHVRGGKRKSSGSELFAVASPFVPESNPCSPASTHYGDENDAEKAYRAWKKPIMILWNEIAAHKYASIFLRPITDEMAPGYHDVVHRPMDLKTIKARIENGTITNTSEFQRDIMLMFLNATMYNTSDHNVYQMATRMMKDTVSSIEEFRTTQMLARASDTPVKSLRRETRIGCTKVRKKFFPLTANN